MALILDEPVSPADLTTAIRLLPTPSELVLTNMFGRREVDTNRIEWDEIVQLNRTAQYRSFDGRINVTQRDQGSGKYVSLPPLSDSIGIGEYERLQREYARLGGSRSQALADAVYRDAANLVRYIQNRVELAWGDLLSDGIITINEGGFQGVTDFGVPSNQKVTAAILWSSLTTAVPLSNIRSWTSVYRTANGVAPGGWICSDQVLNYVLTNTEVINAVHGSAAGRTFVTVDELNRVLSSMQLPVFLRTYDTQLRVDGADVRVLPADRVVFVPANPDDLGYTAWGLTATALELLDSAKVDESFNLSGIVGVVIKDGPPFRQHTFVDAVALPILRDAKKLMTADVA